MDNILLEYKRIPCIGVDMHASKFVGNVHLRKGDNIISSEGFEVTGFPSLVTKLAEVYQDNPCSRVLLRRTERTPSVPLELEPGVVKLLETDVDKVVASLSPAPRRVVVRDVVRSKDHSIKPKVSVQPMLRAGLDTKVETFGSSVYVRARNGEVESPLTGRWGRLDTELEGISRAVCTASDSYDSSKSSWVGILVSDLLGMGVDRFYIPRQWNRGSGWITKEELERKYKSFKKEIADVQR